MKPPRISTTDFNQLNILEEIEQMRTEKSLQLTRCNAVDSSDDQKNLPNSLMHYWGLECKGTYTLH